MSNHLQSLLRQHITLCSETMQERCARARRLERAGNYEDARDALADLWRGIGVRPLVEDLDSATAADVLLCVGTISGRLSSAKQTGTHEAVKDLVSESRAIFEVVGDSVRAAEAQVELGHCYWREGAFDEARITLKLVLETIGAEHTELRALALLRWAVVERSANQLEEALRLLVEAAPLVEASASDFLKGNFHNTRAAVFNFLGEDKEQEAYLDQALIDYSIASFHFKQAGHERYGARVDNNYALLLSEFKRYDEAHERLDCARRLFASLEDEGSVAQVDETRARVLLAQGRNFDALHYTQAAVLTLEKGGEQALLCEALTTHGIALARLNRHQKARMAFQRAVEMGELVGDPEGAGHALLSFIEEMRSRLSIFQLSRAYLKADELLANSNHEKTSRRLRSCAGFVMNSLNTRDEKGSSNLYQFPVPSGHLHESFTLPLPDNLLSGAGLRRGATVTFKLTRQYRDGDLVFALTPDGCFIGFISILPDGWRCLEGRNTLATSRRYMPQEVIVLGIAEDW